ncbi:MAG: nuclear transport factor 2 family protein [Pseudomonadota bacterium]
MKRILAATACAAAIGFGSALAGDWSEDQTAVWDTIKQSWKDEAAENGKWPAQYVHDDVVSWGADWPMPRGKDSMLKWSRFFNSSNEFLEYELMPAKIIVAGDTAVAHYAVVSVTEDHEQDRSRNSEGLIEVLVRDGGDWKFLSLTSFDMDDD